MKIIVFSVNTGGYDELKDLSVVDKNVRYILFTDNKYFKSKVWEVNHVDFLSHVGNNRKIARYIKINSHLILPEHDISIWIDHCFTPKINNFTTIINDNPFENIMCYKHDERNCIYSESEKVLIDKLDHPNVVKKQMLRYVNENFPKNYGLFSTGFLVRKNNQNVKLFNETWWNEILNGSERDQLSQMYSSWKTKIKVDNFRHGQNVYSNPYLNKKIKHQNKWSI